MAKTISKNQTRGKRVEVLECKCGGVIIMRTKFCRGKMTHFAECKECGKTARKPKELM